MSPATKMTNQNVIITFSGVINSEKLADILAEAEKKLILQDSGSSIKKKVYAILVEFLQNLYHHTEGDLLKDKNSKIVHFYLYSDEFNYYVKTQNFIRNSKIPPLQNWIDEVNSLSAANLKKLYLDVMQNSKFSEKGGANLGIIDIVRKSMNPLEYKYSYVNNSISHLKLIATIQHSELFPYNQQKTKYTPEINFDNKTGLLKIEGRSFPEDASIFYTPIIEWLDIYVLQSDSKTALEVYLEFFNTSSSKYLLEIFKRLKKIETLVHKEVSVNWYYDQDDEDMYDTGLDYEEISKLDFKIIEK